MFNIFKKQSKKSQDPVCGMTVDPEKAEHKSVYEDKTYFFCSENCKKTFDENPGNFVN